MTLLEQATLCLQKNDLPKAEAYYQQVLAAQPNNGQAFLGMGCIALKVKQYDKAISLLKRSCELLPQALSPLLHLSEAFTAVGATQDSSTVLDYAKRQFAQRPEVHYQLGLHQQSLGEFEQATQSFKQVLTLTDTSIASFACLELTRQAKFDDNLDHIISQRLTNKNLTTQEKTVLHYANGNILDHQQQFHLAWQNYQQANRLQFADCEFKTQDLAPFFTQIQSSNNIKGLAYRNPQVDNKLTPIFILGLPRTGSTLLEYLLCQHPDVGTVGEATFVSDELANFIYQLTQLDYPASLQITDPSILAKAASIYENLLAQACPNQAFVINKLPANFQAIGMIYKLFPHAKVIHIQRALPEVAWSIFSNYFAQNEPYFCSLNEFGQYYGFYTELMDCWEEQCQDFIYSVNYQDLVKNKTQTLNKIYAFCGLSSKSGTQANNQQQPIRTLSNVQVRQKVNSQAMKKWQNYAEFLPNDWQNLKLTEPVC
ncbi:sulfotransferase [Paraglaciecola aestuariivivens]